MTDINYQLKALKIALAQEEEVLAAISDTHNHAEVREHVEQIKVSIKKLEDWGKAQEAIRSQSAMGSVEELQATVYPEAKRDDVFNSGAPCGSA